MLIALLAVLTSLALTPAASASLSYSNPLRDVRTGKALSCPDPYVMDTRRGDLRYIMVCTTDYGADALSIRRSGDLVHWHPAGYVFPKGRQPWWAIPSTGRRGGRFWAPEIYRIHQRWVVYFAARVDPSRVSLPLNGGTMVVGVASSSKLGGPWRTRILHYRGQFNSVSPFQESFGGTIDPSVVRSPFDGQLYLFWALQATQIWAGRLSRDGMVLDGSVKPVVKPSKPWECDPTCTIEAPEPFFRKRQLNLLYSGASTWEGTYAVGLALGADPLNGAYRKLDSPVLHGGRKFLATGHCSQPVRGPDGQTYMMYQALTSPDPDHASNRRLLMIARVSWVGGRLVVNRDGRAQ